MLRESVIRRASAVANALAEHCVCNEDGVAACQQKTELNRRAVSILDWVLEEADQSVIDDFERLDAAAVEEGVIDADGVVREPTPGKIPPLLPLASGQTATFAQLIERINLLEIARAEPCGCQQGQLSPNCAAEKLRLTHYIDALKMAAGNGPRFEASLIQAREDLLARWEDKKLNPKKYQRKMVHKQPQGTPQGPVDLSTFLRQMLGQ